ncbi:glycoside hydrolase family 9 protein, partial [Aquiflexum sp.]|uniref:glycoside hydrolase family 9 protein n=1 Tax=Aquiflexum sp. TaxID=1872584 RepID=UPI003593280F
MKTLLIFLILPLFIVGCNQSLGTIDPKINEAIRVNQIGYYPNGSKVAIVADQTESDVFFVLDTKNQQKVFEGILQESITSPVSQKSTRRADFSTFSTSGNFCVYVSGLGCSPPFEIKEKVFGELAVAALKSFFFQRASMEITEEFGGIWSRPAGHPDDRVKIHPSAASKERPEGTVLSSPMGWYDAGDYNKYIVNSGITMGTLMSLYEDFSSYFSEFTLEIPESGNAMPDLLDEILWNLKWMATMQDPHDGGVYHKLTTAKFEGMVLPHQATNQRYVVAKSTAATLDFAAVMAQASRILKNHHPDLSIEYLKSAELAWNWAQANPEVYYRQNDMNKSFQPEIHTGAYGDNSVTDEKIWAASELYISTHNLDYLQYISNPESFNLPSWNRVDWLGYYSLLRFRNDLPNLPENLISTIKSILTESANNYVTSANASYYYSVMGQSVKDFVWGSNAVASNQGIALIQVYFLTKESKYLQYALGNLDYILGKNATGYSFVTGFGYKTPKIPHHRLAEAERDKEPLPGFMVGGPNPGQQDG